MESQRPFGINLAGYFESEKGVGESVRAVRRALQAAGIPHVCNNLTDPCSSNLICGPRFASRNPFSVNLVCVNADQLGEFALRFGVRYFAGRHSIGLWNWELAQFPHEWTDAFRFFDEIWAPSRFTQSAIAATSPIPVRHVPYAIAAPALAPGIIRPTFGLPANAFLFLCVFDYNSVFERKNPLAAVRAFQQAFGRRTDVALVLKSSRGDGNPAAVLLRREIAGWANIILVDRVLSRVAMHGLLNLCDALVSLHRAEGFGLPLAEMLALGKPVVATNYSGNTDFLTDTNSFPVRYRLVEIEADQGVYRRGRNWAEPDHEHAVDQLRRAEGGIQFEEYPQFRLEYVVGIIRDSLVELMERPPRVDWRSLPEAAARVSARRAYRWWWRGTRGRFGAPPVAALRAAKRASQRMGWARD